MDRYVIVGNPVEHSQSPFIYAELARQASKEIDYGRLLCPIDGFAEGMRELAQSGAKGCNITVPFKLEAFALAQRQTDRARLAQAANVLLFKPDGWVADNTDGVGLLNDIQNNAGVSLAGKRVLLIGAGGAAAGVLGPFLEALPREIVVANRTVRKAEELIERHRHVAGSTTLRAAPLDDCGTGFDIVVNGSASSLQGTGVPVASSTLAPGALAVDMMYGPAAQPFLDWAAAHGAVGRDGMGMLVEQAAVAYEIYAGVRPASTAPVLAALRQRVSEKAAAKS